MIPLLANPLIHTGGLGPSLTSGPGPVYSERTTGYYAALPRTTWWKHNEIVDDLAWSHLHLALSPGLELSDVAWFRIGKVRHYRVNDFNPPSVLIAQGSTSNVEHYVERSKTFGDRLILDAKLASTDTLSFGGT